MSDVITSHVAHFYMAKLSLDVSDSVDQCVWMKRFRNFMTRIFFIVVFGSNFSNRFHYPSSDCLVFIVFDSWIFCNEIKVKTPRHQILHLHRRPSRTFSPREVEMDRVGIKTSTLLFYTSNQFTSNLCSDSRKVF